jgi:hypothetical protein
MLEADSGEVRMMLVGTYESKVEVLLFRSLMNFSRL